MQELREAIMDIRAVDKDVYVHADMLSTGLYALACAGSHVSVVPTGDVWLTGLYSEQPYLRGLLDKIGVVPDFIQMGDYKSAAEILTRTGPSEPADEMMTWLLDSLYGSLVSMIAESRGMPPEKVKEIIDTGPHTAEKALEAGLIDSVKHRQGFVTDLKERYGTETKIVRRYGEDRGPEIDFSNPLMALWDLIAEVTKKAQKPTKPVVAVVYVEGPILVGSEDPSPFGASGQARSTTIRKALDKAGKDPSVKAVVLRVDSPGGSALASEIIWDATQRVKQKKPLVASMGNVAASGGYYVSCGADAIYADKTTITASIGVIGGKLVTTGMWDKLGISWHPRQRGTNADLLNTSRPFAEKDRKKITEYMENVYSVFKSHVTAGRGEKLTKPLDEMAGGRVYTGAQAWDLGLIDEIGTLDDAVQFAATKANISDYEIRVLPEPKKLMDVFMEMFAGADDEEEDITLDGPDSCRVNLFAEKSPLMGTLLPLLRELDPIRTEALLTALTRLQLIHEESVITMMPYDFVIR